MGYRINRKEVTVTEFLEMGKMSGGYEWERKELNMRKRHLGYKIYECTYNNTELLTPTPLLLK
ncbi:MAG: hypothetical protein FWF09_03860 [Bacteroidales bacterium]|nr:hypothetical protein [Bacteroidales bacterium]